METIRGEWEKLIKNRMMVLTCVAITFIPLLYSSFFLKSVWDPYGSTENLPIAVVNEDRAVEFRGETVEVGETVVENLEESSSMDWDFVSREKAREGLENGDYYMVVTIPENFSENATSVLDESPQKMEIEYETNGSLNFIGKLMGQSATKELKSEVSSKVTSAYADAIVDQIDELSGGIEAASEGSEVLRYGVSKLDSGGKSLNDGMKKLAESTVTFTEGAGRLSSGVADYAGGVSRLSDGSEELNAGAVALSEGLQALDSKVSELPGGVEELNSGAYRLYSGLESAKSATEKLSHGLSSIDSSVKGLNDKVSAGNGLEAVKPILGELSKDPSAFESLSTEEQKLVIEASYAAVSGLGEISSKMPELSKGVSSISENMKTLDLSMSALSDGSEELYSGTKELKDSSEMLEEGVHSLKAGAEELEAGTEELSSGAQTLSSKNDEITSGAETLYDGANKIQSGSSELSDGTNSMKDGIYELEAGADKLAKELKDGAEEANSVHMDERTVEQISSPAGMIESEYSHIPNYGHALAPYVMSLALFIGCLVFNSIFPVREISKQVRTGVSWYIGKFSIGLTVALGMALVEGSVMIMLGLDVESKLKFFSVLMLTAMCYMSIIMTLSIGLDNIGRFLAMILLVVQLGGSGGTFPIELTNGFFQAIHPYLPMSYSIYGLREAISGGLGTSSFSTSISVLLGLFTAFAVILFFTMNLLFKKGRVDKAELTVN